MSADAVFMVDVSGGAGRQAVELKKKFPHLPGRFVVQDLHALPHKKDRLSSVGYMVHGFMVEQQIKGLSSLALKPRYG